jgi:putative phage-type endonuclease
MSEQGTPEWHAKRVGKVTASRLSDMLSKTKTGWGASRQNYKAQLVAERLTGIVADSYTNAAMQWGTDTEAEARETYSFFAGCNIAQVDFVDHPVIAMTGASPDGLVGDAGLVEIKCPNTATHIETIFGGTVPTKYLHQMQWQMACTDRRWCDFVSYDPRMPEDMRLFVRRVERDESALLMLANEVTAFLKEIDETVAKLTNLYRTQQAAE